MSSSSHLVVVVVCERVEAFSALSPKRGGWKSSLSFAFTHTLAHFGVNSRERNSEKLLSLSNEGGYVLVWVLVGLHTFMGGRKWVDLKLLILQTKLHPCWERECEWFLSVCSHAKGCSLNKTAIWFFFFKSPEREGGGGWHSLEKALTCVYFLLRPCLECWLVWTQRGL